MWSAICFNLDQSKILSSGNGLNEFPFHTAEYSFQDIQHHQIIGLW